MRQQSKVERCASCLFALGWGIKRVMRQVALPKTTVGRYARAHGLISAQTMQVKKAAFIERQNKQSAANAAREAMEREAKPAPLVRSAMEIKAQQAWSSALGRVSNQSDPAWADYGGRGITMHKAWCESFAAFVEDVGLPAAEHYTLDRIDNDKGYEPGNARWATRSRQQRNQRRTTWVVLDGERMALRDACEKRGLIFSTVYNRIYQYGWSEQDALDCDVA